MTEISMSIELKWIHVINFIVENPKISIIRDDLRALGKRKVTVFHYLIDRQSDVNFPTKVNTVFYWRISRQRNGVDIGTKVTIFSSINR